MPKQQHPIAMLELGWSYRRIEAETGVRRKSWQPPERAVREAVSQKRRGRYPRRSVTVVLLSRVRRRAECSGPSASSSR